MPTADALYRAWLLERVFLEGNTTLWCARQIKADPEEVRRDFEKYAAEITFERLPLTVERAKQKRCCRICGEPDAPLEPGNPFVYEYGKEYAHQSCLDKLPNISG